MKNRNKGTSEAADAFRERIPAWLAGTLPPAEHAAFEAHLSGCAACAETVADLSLLWDTLPDRAPDDPVDLWPSIQSRLLSERMVPMYAPVSPWRLVASFAAGIAAAVLIWVTGTGGVTSVEASDLELMVQESMFQQLDPVPPESIAGRYLTATQISEDGAR